MVSRRARRTNALSSEMLGQAESLQRRSKETSAGWSRDLNTGILETSIHRAELVNQLSYLRKTAFDLRSAKTIVRDYRELVTEIVYLTSMQATSPKLAKVISINQD